MVIHEEALSKPMVDDIDMLVTGVSKSVSRVQEWVNESAQGTEMLV